MTLIYMHNLRRHRFVKRWVSVVSLLLLLQGLFPAQVHSKLVKDSNGRLTEVCTLEGHKTIVLDDAGNPVDDQSGNNNQRSPAMMFSDLVAEAISNIFLPVVIQDDVPARLILCAYKVAPHKVTSVLMPIRAPPLLMV